MSLPKSNTSSHSSSDDHCFDGPDEYEVEYDEERAAVAEPTSDVDCNEAVGLHYYDPPQSKLCSVYYAIVESHLRYANEIWGSLPKTKLDILQRLQDRARSIVENARYKDNWSCDWLSIENIIRFDRSVMTYKIRNKLSPESLWDKFQQRSSQSSYATRNCSDLQIPRLNSEYAKKSYRYSAVKVWNEIPVAIRELPTISRFKKDLKEYLKS